MGFIIRRIEDQNKTSPETLLPEQFIGNQALLDVEVAKRGVVFKTDMLVDPTTGSMIPEDPL